MVMQDRVVNLDQEESQGLLESELRENRENLGSQDPLDQLVRRVLLVPGDLQATEVHQESKEGQEMMVSEDQPGLRDPKETLVLQDKQERVDQLVELDLQDLWAHKVLMETLVIQVYNYAKE